jgi:hypothetical protein
MVRIKIQSSGLECTCEAISLHKATLEQDTELGTITWHGGIGGLASARMDASHPFTVATHMG